jgi:DNA uptake protein ComE-like DNA-binding protein
MSNNGNENDCVKISVRDFEELIRLTGGIKNKKAGAILAILEKYDPLG